MTRIEVLTSPFFKFLLTLSNAANYEYWQKQLDNSTSPFEGWTVHKGAVGPSAVTLPVSGDIICCNYANNSTTVTPAGVQNFFFLHSGG